MDVDASIIVSILIVLIFLVAFRWRIRKRPPSKAGKSAVEASADTAVHRLPADDWADELEKIKEEKSGEESQRQEAAERHMLEEKRLVAELDGMVADLLSEMGRVQWGRGNYELVSGVEWGDPAWEVRSLSKKTSSDEVPHDYHEVFSVRLRRLLGTHYFSSTGASSQEHTTEHGDLSEAGLKEILRTVMRVGPRRKSEYELL